MSEFTEAAFEQFDEVRSSGVCNMLDRQCVHEVAEEMGLIELELITLDRHRYPRLLTAFQAWKDGQRQEAGR